MSLEITIRKHNNEKLVGFASVIINDLFQLNGIKIWNNAKKGEEEDLSIQMPGYSNKSNNRTYYNPYFKLLNKDDLNIKSIRRVTFVLPF